ncbi:hypothetical protein ZWY2020_046790 [Hordeum vulgare]|nr:hypothetical protein ZWY2020_046790 [Hordeum vulgare]
MIQTSMDLASSPLLAAIGAIHLARHIADKPELQDSTLRSFKQHLVGYFTSFKHLHPIVFHIARYLNGIAHDVAHQVLNSRGEPTFACFRQAHMHV